MNPPVDPDPPARRFSPDMIAALSAVVIGVSALGVSLYQSILMRGQQDIMQAQQHAMVWPYVEIGPNYDETGFSLGVTNRGIGPARIQALRVTVDSTPVRFWDDGLAVLLGGEPEAQPAFGWSSVSGRVLSPGDDVTAFVLSPDNGAEALYATLYRVGGEVCYCSVYDQCWTIEFGFANDPVPSEDCSHIPEAERFERNG